MKRRQFLKTSLAISCFPALPAVGEGRRGLERPLIISTWGFGQPANERALKVLLDRGDLLDAVEQGIRLAEADPKNHSIGLAGTPNAAGVVQLDAAIMLGPGHRAGSVAALEGIRHPISAARRVMEKTPHVMLVGEGARLFCVAEGLEAVEVNAAENYKGQERGASSEGASGRGPEPANTHDTLALLVVNADGNLAGGCSTSGVGGKLPGRVGDSPIIGGGLYVDNDVGAAGATGLGENIMRHCGSFLVVEYMRQGLAPALACREALRRIVRQEKRTDLKISFVALDKQGRYGAATTGRSFPYAVTTNQISEVLSVAGLGGSDLLENSTR